ncbi:MAG: hypothetical protein H7A03_05940 [Pseudomonadales bacterium]|nr:hypothetical protein [Pseudomonadales bacterium]
MAENHQLSFGYDYHIDDVSSSANFIENERDNHSWFAQYLGKIERWTLEAGLRTDDNESLRQLRNREPRYRL